MGSITRQKRSRSGWTRNYFSIVGLLVFALTLLGFSDNLFTNVGQPSNSDPKFIAHGLFCLAWTMIFALQASLIRFGNIRLHQTLGIAGVVIGIGVVLSTIYVFVAVWKGWDAMEIWGRANRLLLPGYAVMLFLAVRFRRRPDLHKRLMLVATLYMLEPVLSRSFDPFPPSFFDRYTESQIDRAWWIYLILVWNGLFLSLMAFDWRTLGRIHPVTGIGYLGFCAIWVVVRIT